MKADDSNANLVEPKGSALYGGEWREQQGEADAAGGAEEVVLLHDVNGHEAEAEEKQSGIDLFINQVDRAVQTFD